MRPAPHNRRGFTLLELLMAITIGAMLMVAATTFVFSMGELWGRGTDERLFDRHVRGVSRFIDGLLRDAAASANAAGQTEAIWWEEPPGSEYAGDEMLTFEVEASPGVLVWPSEALPNVVCFLQFDRDGLFLLWKSRLEADFEDDPPRRTRLSPFVTDIRYFYYDTEDDPPTWDEEDEPSTDSQGDPLIPNRIQIAFTYGETSRLINLVLPGSPAGVPLY